MKPRNVNVDRMRRYAHRRRMRSVTERWARFIDECGLDSIRGPWPSRDLTVSILVPESLRDDLKWLQAAAGITADGVLGPQTWVVLSERARRRDEADVEPWQDARGIWHDESCRHA